MGGFFVMLISEKAVDGREAEKVWKLMDELVEAVKILHPKNVHDFHRQGTRPITKKRAAPLLVLPFSLFCFRFKNERRIFFY